MAAGTGEAGLEAGPAAKAYIYGYPLVYNLHEIGGFTGGGIDTRLSAPFNHFACARSLLTPDARFVTPNNDTLYIIAMCDLGAGPLAVHVPDAADRYYVLQFVDAWTNNFAYIGRRATGTEEGDYALVPWDFDGRVPDGMSGVVRAPSRVFAIVGRIQVNGESDTPAVQALQDQFAISPLTGDGDAGAAAAAGLPNPNDGVAEGLGFWENLRVAIKAFPPPKADEELLAGLEELGLTAEESPYVNPAAELAEKLIAGEESGKNMIEQLMKRGGGQINGWSNTLHVFDYNLDYFSLGTIDSDEWKMSDRSQAYLMRAIAARAGLWGNHGYEAAYFSIYLDADGNQLNGANRYELRLERTPPVDAFWSLTMYDTPDYYLVENPIDRYSIGDRTEGLQTAGDGSLTIYLQKESPGPEKESNWLPAPEGDFRPVMRMYQPGREILEGTYVLPAIVRTG